MRRPTIEAIILAALDSYTENVNDDGDSATLLHYEITDGQKDIWLRGRFWFTDGNSESFEINFKEGL